MSKIRWSFFFDNGSIIKEVEEEQDQELADLFEYTEDLNSLWYLMNSEKSIAYINMSRVNAISRDIIDEEGKVVTVADV